MKFKQKHPTAFLVLLCYLVCLATIVLLHFVQFASNRAAHKRGEFPETQLSINDFELVGLMEKDGKLITTTTDPQLLLKNRELRADSVLFEAEFVYSPHLLMAFHTTPGQDYSVRNGIFGQTSGNTTLFLFPPAGGQSIRLDPGDVAGNPIVVHQIVLNPPRSAASFFTFSTGDWTALVVLPALAASAISIAGEGWRWLKGRKAVKTHG